jgi:hypothetical protein
MSKLHWTQTPEGKAKMSRRMKAHHRRLKKEGRKHKRSRAEIAVAEAVKNGRSKRSTKALRHIVHVCGRDQQGMLHREKHTVKTYGEFFDLITVTYGEYSLEELYVECNI